MSSEDSSSCVVGVSGSVVVVGGLGLNVGSGSGSGLSSGVGVGGIAGGMGRIHVGNGRV